MEKMTGKSLDLIAENIEQLKALFPEAVTEGKIDFEVLKALLGGEIEKRQTYYKFTWNGKEEARAYARVPSMGTLRPCVAESSGRDGTPGAFNSENLYIEGDNLEVLKLLQGPYHKRVKMIYIDPPYNTGKDFVYPDNYRDSLANYKSLTGQTDAKGAATRANPETSGRYHTDWLNMMYPRLILARNLLSDDGVIFISIDDTEVSNLRKLCDDVFGEENFGADIIWKKKTNGNNTGLIPPVHDHILCYGKSLENIDEGQFGFPVSEEFLVKTYSNPDNDPRGPWTTMDLSANHKGPYFAITNPNTGEVFYPAKGRYWVFNENEVQKRIKDGRIIFGKSGTTSPVQKVFRKDREIKRLKAESLWDSHGLNEDATAELFDLFQVAKIFDHSKPSITMQHIINICTDKTGIILDFFSGSSSTAHAVMRLNAVDGGHRHYIMVQLPELCKNDSIAWQAGYKNICEIGKERIRRAGKKIAKDNATTAPNLDIGFKVFKLDSSNFIPWNPEPDKIELLLRNAVENILIDRTRQDLLYEVLLKCNLPLTLPIVEKKFGDNTVYVVGEGALAICLDTKIPQTIADEIVKLRDEFAPIVPMQVVFRDNGFTDVAKTNALQILKQAGFEEKSIQTI